jgi:acetyl-CoA carboxylase biotin carboxyl carrier protein
MNLSQIQDLIKFVAKSGVTEVEIEQKEFKITIKTEGPKKKEAMEVYLPAPAPVVHVPAPAVAAPAAAAPAAIAAPAGNAKEMKSPMIGTFYRSKSPDKPPFVQPGDMVKKGQVLCIIEAMKLFNEIESEFDGKIVKVLADDSQPVEYDQPIFLIEPTA